MSKKSERFDKAAGRLADKIKYGHLLATSDPAGFYDEVVRRIEELEKEVDKVAKRTSRLWHDICSSEKFQTASGRLDIEAPVATPMLLKQIHEAISLAGRDEEQAIAYGEKIGGWIAGSEEGEEKK